MEVSEGAAHPHKRGKLARRLPPSALWGEWPRRCKCRSNHDSQQSIRLASRAADQAFIATAYSSATLPQFTMLQNAAM